jgi:hypothetical protein
MRYLNTTQEQMKDEVLNEINNNGADLDDIKDRLGEWVDGYLPVYNHQIIKEWMDMDSDYTDRGADELGASSEDGIIRRMTLDLYLFYTDQFSEVLDEVEEELKEQEEENEEVSA